MLILHESAAGYIRELHNIEQPPMTVQPET